MGGSGLIKSGGKLSQRDQSNLLKQKAAEAAVKELENSLSGLLVALEGKVDQNILDIAANILAIAANALNFTIHKTSSDHDTRYDSRYYLQAAVDALFAAFALDADGVDTDTTNFDDVLTTSEINVQLALDKLNDLRDYLGRDNYRNLEARMFWQCGRASFNYTGYTITFDLAFTSAPEVVGTSITRDRYAIITTVTTTSFLGQIGPGTGTRTCFWIAMGQML